MRVDLTFPNIAPRRALFVREYLRDLNGTLAAVRAGYAVRTARITASQLLADPAIKAVVDAALTERLAEVKAEATQVVRHLLEVASADPNDLVQSRRLCCRHCWGKGFGYQRTAGEMARAKAEHQAEALRRQAEEPPRPMEAFQEAGGIGYHGLREPNEECPECFGEGVLDVHLTDSRLLRGAARRLYAGVKRTKDGIEVKMRDQDKALELLGRHLGLFVDKLEVKGKIDMADRLVRARRRAGT